MFLKPRAGWRSLLPWRSAPDPGWRRVLQEGREEWEAAKTAARGGPKILIATSLGGYDNGTLLESTLAAALTLRGAEAHVLLCDGALPACQLSKIAKIPPDRFAAKGTRELCSHCIRSGEAVYNPLGLTLHRYSALLSPQDAETARSIADAVPVDAVGSYRHEGLAVGEHALAGALRYFARGDLKGEPRAEAILRKYLESSLRTVFAIRALLRRERFEAACFHHGIYVPQGLIGEVCRQAGVRVVNSNPAYRKQTFVFSHGDTYHHTMVTEPTAVWENMEWNPAKEKATLDYLKSRWQGSGDWIWFHEDPQEEVAKIAAELGVDFSKPCIGMLTSVMWDAQLHYRSNAFPNMLEWVNATIGYFAKRPELQLILRVHPAEVRGMVPSRQKLVEEIRKRFPRLPPNVFLIPPESRVSTYAVMEQCDTVIIYNTKTGIEISSMGIPVVVAGEAWIRNKGFSIDASNPADYFRILDALPAGKKLDPATTLRARKYAHHFFFGRMIPFPFIASHEKFQFELDLRELGQLRPGRHRGLDILCDGILKQTPFVFPDEGRV